jgi:hypothetical protein
MHVSKEIRGSSAFPDSTEAKQTEQIEVKLSGIVEVSALSRRRVRVEALPFGGK